MIIKYPMQPIFNNPIFHLRPPSIYGQKLKWYTSDKPSSYDPTDNLYGPDDIDYHFNSCGFRCDDFKKADIRIVFLGCSITEGIGVRQEEIWAYRILDEIRKDTNLEIPYWNIAMGGAGLDSIIRAYYHYHDIMKPHLVFALLPAYRREIFIPENASNVPIFTNALDDILSKYEILMDERTIHYETEKNLAMLDLILNKHDTMMIWNGWGYSHYPRDYHHKHDMIIEWDQKGRDNMHPGPDSHQKFANGIYFRFRDQILSKIKSIGSGGS